MIRNKPKFHFRSLFILAWTSVVSSAVLSEARAEYEFSEKERSWWALKPLQEVEIPEIGDPRWKANPIDRFVFSALGERDLNPSPEASREEIARRLSFDLVGLPPTPEELDDFLSDESEDAYESYVDRLLASSRYGERWAQHWLDLVRYAESDGFRADFYRPDAWPYRDYVVRSFNEDKPYDQFVREQLAGDEIDSGDPNVLVATGFLRHGIYEYNQRDIRAHWDAIVNEVTDVTGDVFLGLSYQCARCHDHKFDPILQEDYYRLRAFFTPIAWRDDLKLVSKEEKAEFERGMQNWERATAKIRDEMDGIIKAALDKKKMDAVKKFPADIQEMMLKPSGERTPFEEQLARLAHRQVVYEEKRFDAKAIKGEAGERYKELATELATFDGLKPKPIRPAFVATDIGSEPPPTTYKGREGEIEVDPGFLTILEPGEAEPEPVASGESSGRRLALAKWITRPDNPLSTRVIVNRVWQYHFGRGLVATPSDFGHLGEEPSHPELLDWMARTFVEEGWSLKKLHRRIVTSATYRQTARREPGERELIEDPQNRYLWRFSPARLDGDQARDALLLASGELEFRDGGPPSSGNARCRSVYLKRIRNSPDEFLRQFDGPARFTSSPMRSSTTTPTQSLLMINSDWSMARARAMAGNLLKKNSGNLSSAVRDAYIRLFGRQATELEVETGSTFISQMESRLRKGEAGDKSSPATKLAKSEANFSGVTGIGARSFAFDGKSSRLEVAAETGEGDVFTVEAIVNLKTLYPDASVRTVASRWNGKASQLTGSDQGWALGITSEKSRYESRNLIVQLVGEDFQGNIAYEVVDSNLRIPLGNPHYVAAVISTKPTPSNATGGTVTFFAQELGEKPGAMRIAKVDHVVTSGLVNEGRRLVIGGRDDGRGGSLFHGEIARMMISAEGRTAEDRTPFGMSGGEDVFELLGDRDALPDRTAWMRLEGDGSSARLTAKQKALADFCHVLMNSNAFLYLH